MWCRLFQPGLQPASQASSYLEYVGRSPLTWVEIHVMHNMKGALSISRPSARQMPWLNKQKAWLRLRYEELNMYLFRLTSVHVSKKNWTWLCWDVFRFKGTRMPRKWARVQEWFWLDTAKRRLFCRAPEWNRMTQYVISLSSFLVPPTLIAHAAGLKIYKNLIRSVQSAWSGAERNGFYAFCLTFLQHVAICSQQRND